ncbi:unnamed protein product [Paramecium primaurelia]|uniref:acylphosphatase n=1 Tax=Paramecium primaurelia TaxID=5886 RepID=A0A8S1M118_PARPR|nr:unnamed protein product [Paramecium primaurelia]
MIKKYFSFDFQVIGKVQGVYFRKFTKEQGTNLGLVGWVENQKDGSVKGVVQGDQKKCEEMIHWLSNVGSPKSKIEKMIKTNEREIDKLQYKDFSVRDDKKQK